METLLQLRQYQHTVVFSVTHVKPSIFFQFDKVMLLSHGNLERIKKFLIMEYRSSYFFWSFKRCCEILHIIRIHHSYPRKSRGFLQ